MTQNTTAEAWSTDANERGLQAWRDAEARLRARRTPAELAREPLPEELARLAELEASVDVAVGLVDAAKVKMAATFPPIVEGHARQAGGLLSHGPVADTDRYFQAKQALLAAQELEGKARSRHTTAQIAVSEAGQRRYVAATQKESAR